MTRYMCAWILGLGMALGSAAPGVVSAQDAQAQTQDARIRGLEAITVTARKREENLQSVPVAVTAFTARDLKNQGVVQFNDVGDFTPNVRLRNTVGRGNTAIMGIRGIQQADSLITGDPSVALYTDDVYNSRLQGGNLNFFDVDRVEVLKGPQGVLYGKNSPAGAIKVFSKRPDGTFGGYASTTYGTDDQIDLEGAIQFPILAEILSARIAAQRKRRDGWVEMGDVSPSLAASLGAGTLPVSGIDDQGETSTNAGRLSLLFTPTDSLEMSVVGFSYQVRENDPSPYTLSRAEQNPAACGFRCSPSQLNYFVQNNGHGDAFANFEGRNDQNQQGVSWQTNWDWSENHSVKMIYGYRSLRLIEERDQDGNTAIQLHQRINTRSRQNSIELQATGLLMGESLAYTAGFYAGTERNSFKQKNPVSGGALDSIRNLTSEIDAWGLFGHGSYTLTDRTSVWGGIRTTYERREMTHKAGTCFAGVSLSNVTFDPRCPFSNVDIRGVSDRFDAVTWGLGVDFQFNDEIFLYAKADKGFRAGGFNGRAPAGISEQAFDPEFQTTYEVGAKTEWLDHRVRFNMSAFFSKYKDIQTTIVLSDPLTGATGTGAQNTGTADISGAELELRTALIEGLELNGSLGWTWFRYKTGPYAGGRTTPANQLGKRLQNNQPAFMFALQSRYTFPSFSLAGLQGLEPSFQVDYTYQSKESAETQECPQTGTHVGATTNPCTLPKKFRDIEQGNYGLINSRLALFVPDWNVEFALWGRNLLDREYFSFGVNFNTTQATGRWTRNWERGRTVGLDIIWRFGSDAI